MDTKDPKTKAQMVAGCPFKIYDLVQTTGLNPVRGRVVSSRHGRIGQVKVTIALDGGFTREFNANVLEKIDA